MANGKPNKERGTDTQNVDWVALAKISRENFYNRRSVEWKTTFGFWTAIGAFTAAFFTVENIRQPDYFPCLLGFSYLGIFCASIFLWLRPLHDGHAGDHVWWIYYMERAQGESADKPATPSKWEMNHKLWFAGEAIFTAFFLLLSWLLITQCYPVK